jgi:hypothetical protein
LSFLYVILQFFNKSFTHFLHDEADCLFGNFEEVMTETPRKFLNVVLEEDGKYQLD